MNYQQNTPEWEEMRKKMIGASDAPVIMRECKYKSIQKLWREKKGLEETHMNEFMRKGRENEEIARQILEEKHHTWLEPIVIFHPKISFMMASLDAIDPKHEIVAEIKCPSSPATHEWAKKGEIPPHYRAQLQHQMECLGIEEMIYYSFFIIDDTFEDLSYDSAEVYVKKDPEYVKLMIEKELWFYEWMQKDIPPPIAKKQKKSQNTSL